MAADLRFRNGSAKLNFGTMGTADDDDDELFDMLGRELSRSCSLLDPCPDFDATFKAGGSGGGLRGADGWDLLCAAARELALERCSFYGSNIHAPQPPHFGVQQRQLEQADQRQMRWMKLQQQQHQRREEETLMMRRAMLEEQIRFKHGHHIIGANRSSGQNTASTSDWPQNVNNSEGGRGMRALFIGEPGPQKASAGTGVFLPRCPADLHKKPGFPTVLMPERVVQALNLNVDRMRNAQGWQ